jgi:SAM-dependent methyltransferase
MDKRYSEYDSFANIYNRYWGAFVENALPALQELVLDHVPQGAHILDVCCGTGQLAHLLHERGYRVTGVDGSEEMLRYARENAPDCQFILGDARAFSLPAEHDAAISTFDSLNHIVDSDGLTEAFRRVYVALKPGGIFEFDLNMDAGYKVRWSGTTGQPAADHAFIQKWDYDEAERTAQIEFTMFFPEGDSGLWRRSDLTLTQRAHTEDEVRTALKTAGFVNIETRDAQDFKLARERGGRLFFAARKPS